jgi:hypothetical protein
MKTNGKKARKTSASQKKAVQRHRLNPKMKIVPMVDENPRRKGTFGFKSMAIILKAGKKRPMTVGQFEERNGRLRDLHWDLEAGHVKLSGKAS